jgi:hypothetical protein
MTPGFPMEPRGHPGGRDGAAAPNGRPRGGVVMHEAAARRAAAHAAAWPHDDDVEQALAAATKDGERITELLDELSRGRLWLPLPDDGGPVTDGSAVQLPTVVYLGAEFVPAFTSAERLAAYGAGLPVPGAQSHGTIWASDGADIPAAPVPHVIVPAAELARRLPPGIGIALNPGAEASVPIYPEGVAYLAANEWAAGETRIRVGQPPAEPEILLREVSAGLRSVPAARQASRAWLSVPGEGEGLVISVLLDDPADRASQDAVITAVEHAAGAAGPKAGFPIDVTFPGEHEPDDVDRWISDHAIPFHLRA